MRIAVAFLLMVLLIPAFAQTPVTGYTYEDRAGTTGHTIVENGKSFGPYKDLTRMVYSTHAKSGMFLVTKRDKTYVLVQGKESGPFAAGFDSDNLWLADDGKFWAVSLTKTTDGQGEDSASTTEVQLMVNGKLYGPFQAVDLLDYAETGGSWIASVQTGDDQYSVLLNGQSVGTFSAISTVWMSADGKLWGYSGSKDADTPVAVTQDQTYTGIQESNFSAMSPREPHWGYSVRTSEEQETVVVDGKSLTGYLHFEGLTLSPSGQHWGFAAQKLTDTGDYPVVVVDGTEYVGEGLGTYRLGAVEGYTWSVRDGTKNSVQVLEFKN